MKKESKNNVPTPSNWNQAAPDHGKMAMLSVYVCLWSSRTRTREKVIEL